MLLKKLLLLGISLSIFSCAERTTTPVVVPPDKASDIQSIEIQVYGGMLGLDALYSINKDSIKYEYKLGAQPEKNRSANEAIDAKTWNDIVNKIDILEFKTANEGASVQPVDGADIKITLYLKDTTYSKVNAHGSESWTYIEQMMSNYYVPY